MNEGHTGSEFGWFEAYATPAEKALEMAYRTRNGQHPDVSIGNDADRFQNEAFCLVSADGETLVDVSLDYQWTKSVWREEYANRCLLVTASYEVISPDGSDVTPESADLIKSDLVVDAGEIAGTVEHDRTNDEDASYIPSLAEALKPTVTYADGWRDNDPPEYAADGRLVVYRSTTNGNEVGLLTLDENGWVKLSSVVEVIATSEERI